MYTATLLQQLLGNLPRLGFTFSLLILFCFAPTAVFAQTTGSATLRGVVSDPNGAVVPNATVVLVSDRTNAERRVTTNEDGGYTFAAVDPGPYTLRVESANFKTYLQTNLVLAPSDTRGADITLEVGAASETVTVTADATNTLQTETGEKSNTITAAQIENLSIVGRSSLELLRILPGTVTPDVDALQVVGFNTGANANENYSVNGLRGQNNNVSIDGSRVIDPGANNGTIITPNNDMVQEVKVQTSNYAAEYGSSGVQITASTKSGSNDFHGTLYTYARPYQLQANDRQRVLQGFRPDGTLQSPRPRSKFYYPGGNIGGPVYLPRFGEGGPALFNGKDKLFFFFGYEVQRQTVDSGVKTGVVPTLRQRQGDFSEFLPGGIYNSGGANLNQTGNVTAGGVPIPGGVTIPAGFANAGQFAPNNNLAPYIDPTGRALMTLYPLPNFTPTASQNYNYISSALAPINRIDSKARFDYKVSDNTNIYLRLARESELQDGAFGIWWGPSTYELPSHNLGSNLGRSAALNITNVINPTMTNEVVFSASKLKLDNNYAEPERVSIGALGLNNLQLPFGRTSNNAPLAIHSWGQGHGSLQSGLSGDNVFAYNDSFSVTDNLTKIAGSHTLKFGGLIEQVNKEQNFQTDADGTIVLNGNGNQNATNTDFGDLLVGRPQEFRHSTPSPVGRFRLYNIEGYAQDAWKVRPNFTLEYGVRIAYLPNNKERNGLDTLFDPSTYIRGAGAYVNNDPLRPNGLLSARRGDIPQGAVEDNPPQIAPRLNFAWDIGGEGNFVVRGGAGLFYNRVQGNAQYDPAIRNPPFGIYSVSEGALTSRTNASAFTDNVADLTFSRLGQVRPFNLLGGLAFIVPDPDSNNIPRIGTMSLSVAKRLPFGNVLEVAYVGTLGRHLPNTKQINVIQPGALLSGTITDPGGPAIGNPADANYVAARGPAVLDLSNPTQRAALSGDTLLRFRPYPDLNNINYRQYTSTSAYHSLQATLNRQLGRDLQYFVTYTFSKALGTLGGDGAVDPIDTRGRSFGVLDFDRTHIINVSYNYNLPDGARGGFSNFLTRGVLNGWQVSGISNFQSGRPIRPRFTGNIGINAADASIGFLGTNAFDTGNNGAGGIAPVYLSNPIISTSGNVGDRVLDINAFGLPAFGTSGPTISPYYIRSPNRNNHDMTFFKNFNFDEDGTKRLQFRAGLFNIFNQAFPRDVNVTDFNNSDIDLRLETECVSRVNGIRNGSGGISNNVCDPTGGYRFTQNTLDNFGRIRTKRGRRIIEVALKFYF